MIGHGDNRGGYATQNNRRIIFTSLRFRRPILSPFYFSDGVGRVVIRRGILSDGVGSGKDITPLLEHGSDAVPRQRKG